MSRSIAWKDVRPTLLRILLSATLTLLLIELALQGVAHLGPRMSKAIGGSSLPAASKEILNSSLYAIYQFSQDWNSWEQYFVSNYESGAIVYQGLHSSHPTRGWSLKPNLSEQRGEVLYSTNSHGYRSLYEFEVDPERYGVLVVGDSFTFGDDIDDRDTWPHQLQERDARLNVLNLAGTGYGIGQMYITLEEEIARYKPKLVIAAFSDQNLHRSVLPFRDYKKPRFILEKGELHLTNVPIGEVDEVYREARLKIRRSARTFRLSSLYRNLRHGRHNFGTMMRSEDECDPGCLALNRKLFESMHELAREHGAEFMMLYLPHGKAISKDLPPSPAELFFKKYRTKHANRFLNPRRSFLAARFRKAQGHYTRQENHLVSGMLKEKLKSIDSWRRFVVAGQE